MLLLVLNNLINNFLIFEVTGLVTQVWLLLSGRASG